MWMTTILQGMRTQGYDMEGLAQSNAVLTSSNSAVLSHLAHITVTIDAMQAQLKTLASAQTNQASPKMKHYWWSCGSNYTHGIKTWSSKKAGHQEEVYYNKSMGGSEKGCEWRFGEIVNKVENSNPKFSLINYIDTPPNPTSTNILAIVDSGANKHLARQATPTIAPVIMENEIKARLPDGSTMESTHISTLQIPDLSNQSRQVYIFKKMQTASLISFWVPWDYGCTITLEKQDIYIKKNGEEIIKGTRKKYMIVGSSPGSTTIIKCGE